MVSMPSSTTGEQHTDTMLVSLGVPPPLPAGPPSLTPLLPPDARTPKDWPLGGGGGQLRMAPGGRRPWVDRECRKVGFRCDTGAWDRIWTVLVLHVYHTRTRLALRWYCTSTALAEHWHVTGTLLVQHWCHDGTALVRICWSYADTALVSGAALVLHEDCSGTTLVLYKYYTGTARVLHTSRVLH